METFLDLCRARRSVRAFRPDAVPEDVLNYILECVRLAPSAVNFQPWHVTYITDKAVLAQLTACYDRTWFRQIPACFVITCRKGEQWVRKSDGKPHGQIDVAIATEHLCLSAAEKGLGTCWVCNFDAALCARLLSLPADEEPVVLVPIGYPADEPAEKQRKPLSAIFNRMG